MNKHEAFDQLYLTNSVEPNLYPVPEIQSRWQELNSVLHVLVEQIATRLNAQACCIYVLDQKTQELIPRISWSRPNTDTNFTKRTINEGIVGLAAQVGLHQSLSNTSALSAVRVDNLKNDSRFKSIEADFPHRSVLALPIIAPSGNRLFGVLLVADKIDSPSFSLQDEQQLKTFSNQPDIVLAIQNLELYQEQQRWTRGLTVINQINQALADFPQGADPESICRMVLSMPGLKDLFQFDTAEICLWDDQTEMLTTAVRLPKDKTAMQSSNRTHRLNEGYTGWIAANRKSLLIGDTFDYAEVKPKVGVKHFACHSYIGTPLKSGMNLLGTFELAASSAYQYDQTDVAILEIVANRVAIAMENDLLFRVTKQQLQKRSDELTGLRRVSNELNRTRDSNRILTLVLKEAMRVTQADFGNVDLYDSRTGELTAYREPVWSEDGQTKEAENFEASSRSSLAQIGIMKRSLRTNEAILVPNVQDDEDFIDQDGETHSVLVVPIQYGDEPVGVISLESKKFNFFTDDQIRYLEALASQSAVAIGNAQAYQEQKQERELASRRASQLSRLSEISNAFRTDRSLNEVLEDIVYAIQESVGYNVVLISLILGDPPVIHHKVGAGIPVAELEGLRNLAPKQPLSNLQAIMLEEFCLGNAYFIPADRLDVWQNKLDIRFAHKDRPLAFDMIRGDDVEASENAWQAGDLLMVPLTNVDEKIIGLVTVDDPDTNQRPDSLSIQPLEVFANHAAVAIENAQLFEREQQRRRLADTLRGVAETISSQLEFDELLNIVLQELRNVVDYDKATVELLEEDRLIIIGGQGWEEYSQQMIGLSFSMEGDNPSRRVLETQEPIIIEDTRVDYATLFSAPPYDRIRSWLGVPLTYGTNVLGLMTVNSSQIDFFIPEDADVVLAFANQVAVALQNARYFDEARQQVRQLAALTEVAQSINRALDLDEVLNLVLDAVFDLVGYRKGSIWLIDLDSTTLRIANTDNIPEFLVESFNESAITIDSEPFASVINSGQIQVIKGSVAEKDEIANYGLPFPDDVTYVPLKTDDGVIGILAIEALIHNPNTLQLVTTLADLAAVAIDNAQLVQRLNLLTEELEQRVAQRTDELARTLQDLTEERDRVETLYQITRELSASLDLDRVLIEALNLINRAIGISHGSILLLDHGSGELIYRAALGRDKPLPRGGIKTNYRLGYGLAGTVMETRQPRIVPDLSADPDWIEHKDERDHRSAIAIPLATGEGLMGALILYHPDIGYFTEDHLKLVSAAGVQIANAINNAELYRLITDQAERLGTMLRTEASEAAKNEAILKGITDGVLVLDPQHNVVLVNPKASEILDITAKAVENHSIHQILEGSGSPEESDITQLFYKDLIKCLSEIEAGEPSSEFRIEAGNKAVVVTLAPTILGTEATPSIVAVLRDISKEAQIERIKNEFISTVSHELRTPLTSIKGYADLLVSGSSQVGGLNTTQNRFVQVIQSNANRLTDLVNDILEISRIETGRIKLKLEPVDIAQTIKEATISFEGQIAKKALDLSVHLPDKLPKVYADKARLTQILVNLIGNAWQYTPEGGKIAVSAAIVDHGSEFVQIDVADTGIGIPEKDIGYIFDRFFRSERPEVEVIDGTGLGLSITKSFVELLKGEIWVESELDVGTTFSFTIPVESAEN